MQTGESTQVTIHGKFFSRSERKFFFKAIRLERLGGSLDLSGRLVLRDRLEKLSEAHTTALIVAEADADEVLDLSAQAGLCAIVEVQVAPDALLKRSGLRAVEEKIGARVRALNGRPGLVGYLVDCPLTQDFLRAHGLERIRRRLRRIIAAIKQPDSDRVVAIKHRPATRAISLPEEDLIYSVIPPLSLMELREYVVGLHNLAQARPIVIEFELPSDDPDEMVACAFGLGAGGVVAPAARPMPRPDLLSLKTLSADELMPFLSLNGTCPPQAQRTPMVSVVICAYNAERTMRACLESLRNLDYPRYEVVIVDDGSGDMTAQIAMDFPEFRLIRQPNKGLSVARNVGMHAALGDLIAYTDSDCVVDPHWLSFMVRAIVEGGFDGCGGPNYAPHEDGRIEGCVAASPGAPCHVLTGEDSAEHLAGCNMIFAKSALLAVDGFDPQFTSAGDDVDICWRMLEAGYKLGFCPSAFVWHFRRNTVKAYYGQQRGYGRAEAMLYAKYPERFNALGQIRWSGMIPGLAGTLPGGGVKRVLWGAARPALQTVYEPVLGLLNFLPQTLEWNVAGAAILLAAIAGGFSPIPALAMLALGPLWAAYYAWQAPLEKCHWGLGSRMIVSWLAYSGPIVRAVTRYKLRFRATMGAGSFDHPAVRQRPQVDLPRRSIRLSYWNEAYIARDVLLDRLRKLLARTGCLTITDRGWNDFDLEVRPGPLVRIEVKTADEEHGGMRLKSLVMLRVRTSAFTRLLTVAGIAGAAGATLMTMDRLAFVIGSLTIAAAAVAISEGCDSLKRAYRAVEQCAAELELIPMGAQTTAARRASSPAAAPLETPTRPRRRTAGRRPPLVD